MPEISSFTRPVFDEWEPLETSTLNTTPVVHSTIDDCLPPLLSNRIWIFCLKCKPHNYMFMRCKPLGKLAMCSNKKQGNQCFGRDWHNQHRILNVEGQKVIILCKKKSDMGK